MAIEHFLLSAKARTLSLKSVFRMGEDKAYQTFCDLRWTDTDGEPVCPRCGCTESYTITTRRKFKCVGCGHQFSVTTLAKLADGWRLQRIEWNSSPTIVR